MFTKYYNNRGRYFSKQQKTNYFFSFAVTTFDISALRVREKASKKEEQQQKKHSNRPFFFCVLLSDNLLDN